VSAGGQILLAVNGHFHVRPWAVFHVRRQQSTAHRSLLTSREGRRGYCWTDSIHRGAAVTILVFAVVAVAAKDAWRGRSDGGDLGISVG
jgi:hypothetical protein